METMAHFFSLWSPKKSRVIFSLLPYGFLVTILLFAAFLRLYRIGDYMTFLGDEGRDALVAYNILHGQFTLLGPTASVGGFFLGPIYYYFMAPFLWLFSYDPVGPAVMVALFGVATVFFIYKVGSEFFSRQAGLMAAFFYSVSPVVIAYSRSSWNPNLMPFFTLATLYALYKGVALKRRWLYILSGVFLGIAMQLHYLATFLGVISILYLLIYELSLTHKTYMRMIVSLVFTYTLFFLGFLAGWSLFLAFEIRHGFPNTQSIIRFVFHSGDTGGGIVFLSTVQNVFFRLFGRLITAYPPPEQVNLHEHLSIGAWYYSTLLLGVMSTIFLFFALYQAFVKKSAWQSLLLLVVWGAGGILLFGFYKKPIYDYYFGFLFPLPFLIVGNVLWVLFSRYQTVGKIAAIVAFLTIAYLNLKEIPFLSPPNRQKEQVKEITQFVLAQTDNKPFNFALLTLGNSDHGYRYFMKLEGKDPITIQNPYIDPKRQTVTDQLFVICEDAGCKPLGSSLWEIAGFGRAEIAKEWGVSVIKLYKLVPYTGSP